MAGAETHGSGVQHPWREVLISNLLQAVRVRIGVYVAMRLRGPWGIKIVDEGTTFHIVIEGDCWLQDDNPGGPVRLTAGDFALVSRGGTQIICDSQSSPIIKSFSFPGCECRGSEGRNLETDGSGRLTRIVSGSMQFESSVTGRLLDILPPLTQVKKLAAGRRWLWSAVVQLVNEIDPRCAGSDVVLARLADIVFIEAIRSHFNQTPTTSEHGWLAGIHDSQIGPALALLHASPLERWTVGSLARRVATSRSLFAAKFAQLVGEPPLHYLKRLRLNEAALKLRSTGNKLGVIAADAGYESPASFTKAFKSQLGVPPGEYRRLWLEKTQPARPWLSTSKGYKHCGRSCDGLAGRKLRSPRGAARW